MKILIFADRNSLKNTGGPTGYLYNISEYLKKKPIDSIEFIDASKIKFTIWSRIKNFISNACISLSKRIPFCHLLACSYKNYYQTIKLSKETISYLNTFDIIHVHSSITLRYFFQSNKIKAKLIVTSHCPEPVVYEMFGFHNKQSWLDNHTKVRDLLIEREVMAYDLCDYIMFPVAEAREPYETISEIYKKKFSELNYKFFYIPTALGSVEKIDSNNHTLDSHRIPTDALRLCYVGRHTKVKGYDFLKHAATKTWEILPNAWFIIGGSEFPLKGLNDNRWLELGWVKTAELLNEVDAFILPNKNTYFDLILLEVLRQGTPVILSRTGGNKWFENKKIEGLKFFDYGNDEELVDCINEIKYLKDSNRLQSVKESNMQYCQREFNMELYLQRYIDYLSIIAKQDKCAN